jgi:hypothetical protein
MKTSSWFDTIVEYTTQNEHRQCISCAYFLKIYVFNVHSFFILSSRKCSSCHPGNVHPTTMYHPSGCNFHQGMTCFPSSCSAHKSDTKVSRRRRRRTSTWKCKNRTVSGCLIESVIERIDVNDSKEDLHAIKLAKSMEGMSVTPTPRQL